jgi:hypothetical protein
MSKAHSGELVSVTRVTAAQLAPHIGHTDSTTCLVSVTVLIRGSSSSRGQ